MDNNAQMQNYLADRPPYMVKTYNKVLVNGLTKN